MSQKIDYGIDRSEKDGLEIKGFPHRKHTKNVFFRLESLKKELKKKVKRIFSKLLTLVRKVESGEYNS